MRNAHLSSKNYFYQNILYGLARQAKAHCRPNPAVAAMILHKGHCVAWGITQPVGGEHAEVVALHHLEKCIGSARFKALLKDKQNTSMLVTFAPCHFQGRTPACSRTLVSAGLKRIAIAHDDSHAKVKSLSLKYLKSQGVVVDDDFLPSVKNKLLWLNYDYLLQRSPTFTIKCAMTADGKMATQSGDSHWITSEMARADARYERACHDAVIIGAGTFLSDNPRLDIRGFEKRKGIDWEMVLRNANTDSDFLSKTCDSKKDVLFSDIQKKNDERIHFPKPVCRIIFFSRDVTQAEGKKLLQSHLFSKSLSKGVPSRLSKEAPIILLVGEHHHSLRKMCDRFLQNTEKNIEMEMYPKEMFPKTPSLKRSSSRSILRSHLGSHFSNFANFVKDFCRRRGIHSVFVEGGARLQSSFLEAGLCDRLLVYLAPKLLGDGLLGLSPFSAEYKNLFVDADDKMQMKSAMKLKLMATEQIGEDIKLSYLLENAKLKKVLPLLQL